MKYIFLATYFLTISINSLAIDLESMQKDMKMEIVKYLDIHGLVILSITSQEMQKSLNHKWHEVFDENFDGIEPSDPTSYFIEENEINWMQTFVDTAKLVTQSNAAYLKGLKEDEIIWIDITKQRNKWFVYADIPGVCLCNTRIDGFNFSYANLQGAYFDSVNIINSNFSHTNLHNAKINISKITNSDFSYTNLTNVEMDEFVDFEHVDFSNANFNKAILDGTGLSNSNFSCATLKGTIIYKNTNFNGSYYICLGKETRLTTYWIISKAADIQSHSIKF